MATLSGFLGCSLDAAVLVSLWLLTDVEAANSNGLSEVEGGSQQCLSLEDRDLWESSQETSASLR